MNRFGNPGSSECGTMWTCCFLLLASIVSAPAFAQSGVLKPNAGEDRVGETYGEPTPGSVLDSVAGYAAHFIPPGPGVDGTTSMPRRTFAQSAGVVSNQLGYEAAFLVERVTSGFKPQRVIDGDWKRVVNTKAIPYCAVCYIESDWPDGSGTAGTAFFVGKRVLLTNAHNVYDRRRKTWANVVRIYPGRDGAASPFNADVWQTAHIPTPYTTAKDADKEDYDIAWIVLPSKTLFNKIGYTFGFMSTTDSKLTALDLNSAGYPGTKNAEQWRDFETKNQIVRPMQFDHYHDIVGGNSGSPMYWIEKKERYAVGVNTWEYTERRANGATRITKEYYDYTKQFIKQNP